MIQLFEKDKKNFAVSTKVFSLDIGKRKGLRHFFNKGRTPKKLNFNLCVLGVASFTKFAVIHSVLLRQRRTVHFSFGLSLLTDCGSRNN